MSYRSTGLISLCAAAFSTVFSPAYAAELPTRTPGQWELNTVAETMGMRTVKTCIAAGDNIVLGDNAKDCGPIDVKTKGDETFVNVTCTTEKGHKRISTLLTGDFTSWYRAVTKITFDPPQDGVAHVGVIVDGKFLGPDCNAGGSSPEKQ
jgi:hypothetical protein